MTPCIPSPCGSNAICKEQNGIGACQCLPEYYGNPYEGCRPECVVSSDCPSNKACVNSKCQDPCPGACAQNAECRVVNHAPSCYCGLGFTGNPYTYCNFIQNERKIIYFQFLEHIKEEIPQNVSHQIHIKTLTILYEDLAEQFLRINNGQQYS